MLNVSLELRCNVCGNDRFTIPTLDEPDTDIRCVECLAFKCHADELEQHMMAASSRPPSPFRDLGRSHAR